MKDHKKPKGAGKSSFELINPDIIADILPVKPGPYKRKEYLNGE